MALVLVATAHLCIGDELFLRVHVWPSSAQVMWEVLHLIADGFDLQLEVRETFRTVQQVVVDEIGIHQDHRATVVTGRNPCHSSRLLLARRARMALPGTGARTRASTRRAHRSCPQLDNLSQNNGYGSGKVGLELLDENRSFGFWEQ